MRMSRGWEWTQGGVRGRPTCSGRPCLGGPWHLADTGDAPWCPWWPCPCNPPDMRNCNNKFYLVSWTFQYKSTIIQYLQQSSNHVLYLKYFLKLQLTKYYIFHTFKFLYIYVCIPGVSFYPNFHVTRLINSWQTCHYCTVLESIDIMTTDNILQHGLNYTILSPSSRHPPSWFP